MTLNSNGRERPVAIVIEPDDRRWACFETYLSQYLDLHRSADNFSVLSYFNTSFSPRPSVLFVSIEVLSIEELKLTLDLFLAQIAIVLVSDKNEKVTIDRRKISAIFYGDLEFPDRVLSAVNLPSIPSDFSLKPRIENIEMQLAFNKEVDDIRALQLDRLCDRLNVDRQPEPKSAPLTIRQKLFQRISRSLFERVMTGVSLLTLTLFVITLQHLDRLGVSQTNLSTVLDLYQTILKIHAAED